MSSSVQRPGKAVAAEKSNFAQTCNRLSQYLKQRGSFPNIISMPETTDPEGLRVPATTLNLLPSMKNSTETSAIQNSVNKEPVKVFPQHVGFAASDPVDDSVKVTDVRKSCPAVDQMTIFYGGRVIVFDNFPAEKAEEMLTLARKGACSTLAMEKTHKPTMVPFSKLQELRSQADDSDLPIVRRASLHRFLEKRKERVASKAPYQVNNNPSSPAHHPMPDERNFTFECRSSEELELKL